MNEIDVQLVDMLGPKTDADRLPLVKKKEKIPKQRQTISVVDCTDGKYYNIIFKN